MRVKHITFLVRRPKVSLTVLSFDLSRQFGKLAYNGIMGNENRDECMSKV